MATDNIRIHFVNGLALQVVKLHRIDRRWPWKKDQVLRVTVNLDIRLTSNGRRGALSFLREPCLSRHVPRLQIQCPGAPCGDHWPIRHCERHAHSPARQHATRRLQDRPCRVAANDDESRVVVTNRLFRLHLPSSQHPAAIFAIRTPSLILLSRCLRRMACHSTRRI